MGYYSGVCGTVRMTEKRFRKMMTIAIRLLSFSKPQTLGDFFQEVTYEDGACAIGSDGTHYDLARMIGLLARFKEGDEPDEVIYQGDSGLSDSGTYFLLPGRWAYAPVQYPTIDDVRDGDWVTAARPTRKGKRRPSDETTA